MRSTTSFSFRVVLGLGGLLVGLALASGCGGNAGLGNPAGDDGGSGDAATAIDSATGTDTAPDLGPADATPDGSSRLLSCTGLLPHPVDSVRMLMSGGMQRQFRVHVPASYNPDVPTPVVLNFHGFTSDSSQQILLTNMNAKADAEGFIAVHPDGTGVVKSWNAGLCCGDALNNNTDDVGFVRAMLDNLASDLCVDPQRIFATGMSNGGFLSHRLACELGDRIAAVAPVAGVMGLPSCTPVRPVPIMHFHGTSDPLVPYMGGQPLDLPEFGGVLPTFPSVPDTFEGWRQRNGCPDPTTTPPTITYQNGDVTCRTFEDCRAGAETTLCTVDGGGHTWPGGFPIEAVAIYLGHTTMDIIATDAMWTFFQRHPLP